MEKDLGKKLDELLIVLKDGFSRVCGKLDKVVDNGSKFGRDSDLEEKNRANVEKE